MASNQTSTNQKTFDPKSSITAVIITKNEEQMIANCLDTLRWCDVVLVVDTGSTDHTREIAQRNGAQVVQAEGSNFSEWRNEALPHVDTAWVLYIDADERVTPELAKTLQSRAKREDYDAYRLRRNNIMWGKWFQSGGWQNDVLLRMIRKTKLKGWVGEVHEHAEVIGKVGEIEEPLVHLTHRSLYDGLKKSIEWTDVEAHLMLEANHPRVSPLRLCKIVFFDIVGRIVFKKAGKDGQEGTIEAMIQTMNRFLVYTRLWELQQKPPISQRYERIEQEIQKLWDKA